MDTKCLSYAFLGNLLLLVLVVQCADDANLKANGGDLKLKGPVIVATKNGTSNVNDGKKGTSKIGSDAVFVTPVKKIEGNESSKVVVNRGFLSGNNSSKPLEGKKGLNEKVSKVVDTSKNSTSVEVKAEDKESGTLDGVGERSDLKKEKKGLSTGVEIERLRDEECDPAYMCLDEKINLTACLRVPGDDSPDLSLLIQNKGKNPVTVAITAPTLVQLEATTVQLQPSEDKKVKVTIAYDEMDSLIFLTTNDSRCTLDFRELIPHSSGVETETQYAFKLRYINLTKTRFFIFLAVTAFLLFGCIGMYFGWRKQLGLGRGYQTVEMELPISDVQEKVSESDNRWNNSWDNSWNDEEAPMTPALPTTPSLSSRGRASRRLSKEGWKD